MEGEYLKLQEANTRKPMIGQKDLILWISMPSIAYHEANRLN
jgi:hypothetical protein